MHIYFNFAAYYRKCGANLRWTLSDDGTLTISGTGAMRDWAYGDSVPWHSVRSNIKSVIIENDVTSIGNYAFYGCRSLTSITIPNGVTNIGNSAFKNCSNLTSITIPNSVISIGSEAFYNCRGLTNITLPDSVTNISAGAFDGCSKLTDVYYDGSEQDWANINIGADNTPLTNAKIHYNVEIVSAPTLSISSITDSSVTVKAKGCDEISEGVIILAIYNNKGVLEQLKAEPFKQAVTFDGLKLKSGIVKAMLWDDPNGLNPLTKAAKKEFYIDDVIISADNVIAE